MASKEEAAGSSGSGMPVCFDMTGYDDAARGQAAGPSVPKGRHRLHGADDLITLFGLRPLWERSVRPYMASSSAATEAASLSATGAEASAARPDDEKAQGSSSGEAKKPLAMDKTYAAYVHDLPGKVRPNRKSMNRYHSAAASASAAGAPPPAPPAELSGRTTMRDIVFRPETTVQRIGPFERETLRAAFTVAAGAVPDIDLSLLESDGPERSSPSKRKKKRKHQRDPDENGHDGGRGNDSIAAKRSKLQALVSGSMRS